MPVISQVPLTLPAAAVPALVVPSPQSILTVPDRMSRGAHDGTLSTTTFVSGCPSTPVIDAALPAVATPVPVAIQAASTATAVAIPRYALTCAFSHPEPTTVALPRTSPLLSEPHPG